MAKKWIPNGDLDFLTKAEGFARCIAKDPARYFVPQAESDELTAVVARFRAAYKACRFGERSAVATRAKEDAREEAALVVRRLGQLLRANPRVDAVARVALGIPERSKTAKQTPCPQEPPRLKFV